MILFGEVLGGLGCTFSSSHPAEMIPSSKEKASVLMPLECKSCLMEFVIFNCVFCLVSEVILISQGFPPFPGSSGMDMSSFPEIRTNSTTCDRLRVFFR